MLARFAHNEYLELLATQGLIGLASLCFAAGLMIRAWRRRPQVSPVESAPDGTRIGVMGALVAFAVHSAFDFLWHIPLLPLVAALLAGYLLTHADRGGLEEQNPGQALRRPGADDTTSTSHLDHLSLELVEGPTHQ